MARLACVMELPECAVYLTKAVQPLDRAGLDAKQSGDLNVADSVNAYAEIAALFKRNNPVFQHVMQIY